MKSAIEHLAISKQMDCEYIIDVVNPKKRRQFINDVKRICRSSMEYKDYIAFLKEFADMKSCAFFANVCSDVKNNPENKKIKIEIHHEPFTLEDLVDVVIQYHLDNGMPLNEFDIAELVMEAHYKNMVGLIPLSVTIHQAVHNSDKIPIPLHMVYGSYSEFVRDYKEQIAELELDVKLQNKIEQTKNLTLDDFQAIFTRFQYLDVDGREEMHGVEDAEGADVSLSA